MSRFIRDAINLDIQKMLIFWDRRSIKLLLVTVAQLDPPLKNVVPSRNFLKGSLVVVCKSQIFTFETEVMY
jgi:hypothetical protein